LVGPFITSLYKIDAVVLVGQEMHLSNVSLLFHIFLMIWPLLAQLPARKIWFVPPISRKA